MKAMSVRKRTRATKPKKTFVRYRHRHVPTFRTENQPAIEMANLDKVKIWIGQAYRIRFQNIEHYNNFKSHLARHGLFQQGFGNRQNVFKVTDRWLFGGELRAKRVPSESGGYTAEFSLELFLNLNRFINHIIHQYSITPEGLSRFIRRSRGIEHLEKYQFPLSSGTLDRQDNMLPDTHFMEARPALRLFIHHLQAVLSGIEQVLTSSGGTESQLEIILGDLAIKEGEIYWEYAVSDAIAFVNGLQPLLVPMFRDRMATEYILGQPVENHDLSYQRKTHYNSVSLKLNLGSRDINLVVYAKAQNRVRFEVRFSNNMARQVNLSSRHLPIDFYERIEAILDAGINSARERLERVFENLPDLDFSERCSFQDFLEFLTALASACHEAGIPDDLQKVIGLLASNGSITVETGSPEHEVGATLEKGGILALSKAIRNERGLRHYRLTLRYAATLNALSA